MKALPLLARVLALGTIVSSANAAIIASGTRDIVITTDFGGVYLDVDGATITPTEGAGWDINPFFGGEGIATSPAFQAARTTIALDAPILNLTPGQTIGPSLNYLAGYAGSESHVGNGAGQFVSGVTGYIGFRLFTNENDGPFYGWMKVVLTNNGTTGLIREWAYEDSGNAITVGAGAVPEPSVICSLLLAAAGGFSRRRRK
jgi:hypothetical protein